MTLKNGGKTEWLTKQKYVTEINIGVYQNSSHTIVLVINNDSDSYLSLEEALNLRDELNKAIKIATGV